MTFRKPYFNSLDEESMNYALNCDICSSNMNKAFFQIKLFPGFKWLNKSLGQSALSLTRFCPIRYQNYPTSFLSRKLKAMPVNEDK